MLKSILGTNFDVDRLMPWLRRGPARVPLFFPKPGVRWSKMCTGQPSFCLPFGFYFSLGCFHWVFASLLFGFLDKAGVFVGSSVVVPPVFPFFSPCLPCPFVFCLVCFASFFFLFLLHSLRVHSCWGFVCTFSSFVDCLFIFWRVSCGGSCSPFSILIFALCAKASNCISESFGRSGYIPCRIGKDGGFIRRDRSFHLGSGDSSVVRAPDSWLKGRGFESLQERRENFLLQGQLSVLTLISVSVPPPCYRSST